MLKFWSAERDKQTGAIQSDQEQVIANMHAGSTFDPHPSPPPPTDTPGPYHYLSLSPFASTPSSSASLLASQLGQQIFKYPPPPPPLTRLQAASRPASPFHHP